MFPVAFPQKTQMTDPVNRKIDNSLLFEVLLMRLKRAIIAYFLSDRSVIGIFVFVVWAYSAIVIKQKQ